MAWLPLLSLPARAGPGPSQGPSQGPQLTSLGTVVVEVPETSFGASGRAPSRWVLDASGHAVARLTSDPRGEARLRLDALVTDEHLDVAPYRRWLGSPDGRTLVGVGDPAAPEHPFALGASVYRDGRLVHEEPRRWDPATRFLTSEEGRLAIVGHPVGERERWSVELREADGARSFVADLPAAAAGAAVVGSQVWILTRADARFVELDTPGELWRVVSDGARRARALPGATEPGALRAVQELVAFPALGLLLVRTAAELVLVDVRRDEVRWRRAGVLRPAGPHAWAAGGERSGSGAWIAVLHSDVRRRDGVVPGLWLERLDVATGVSRGRARIERRGPLAAARLTATDARRPGRDARARLVLAWGASREEFTWER